MGPLITVLAKRLHLSATASSSKRGVSDKQGPSRYALRPHRGFEHGFKRMDNDGSGDGTLLGLAPPIIGKGASELDEEMSNMDQLGELGITVKTDLEQNYDDPMPPREAVF